MRAIVLMILLGACGGDDGAHDVVDCDSAAWGARKECERACATQPMAGVDTGNGIDTTCVIDYPGTIDGSTGKPIHGPCLAKFVADYEGERGCCATENMTIPVTFVPCEGR